MSPDKTKGEREIATAQEKFARDEIDAAALEDEVEFWTLVDECDLCRAHPGQTLCTFHFERLVYGF